MTDHTYEVEYTVRQTIRIRTEGGDPEDGNAELRKRVEETKSVLSNTFVQGIGKLFPSGWSTTSSSHTLVSGQYK